MSRFSSYWGQVSKYHKEIDKVIAFYRSFLRLRGTWEFTGMNHRDCTFNFPVRGTMITGTMKTDGSVSPECHAAAQHLKVSHHRRNQTLLQTPNGSFNEHKTYSLGWRINCHKLFFHFCFVHRDLQGKPIMYLQKTGSENRSNLCSWYKNQG